MMEANQTNTITYEQMNAINNLRMLLMEFIMCSRVFITSLASGYGELEAVGLRLYKLPVEIGNIFELFLGQKTGNQIKRLFTDQLLIGAEIIRAKKNGDTEAIDAATLRLYQNGNVIASYLEQVNPYWDEQIWSNLYIEFLKTKVNEILATGAGNFNESIIVTESLRDQSLNMADYRAKGFIQYFY